MTRPAGRLIVVDDNAGIRTTLQILLTPHFQTLEILSSPKYLISTVQRTKPDAVLLDMNFDTDINTGNEGLFWLSELKRQFPELRVVLFTAYADISLAVEGMKRGAFDFITKPWENNRLLEVLRAAVDAGKSARRKKPGATDEAPAMYWGNGTAVSEIRRTVEKIAPTDASVLITGENGTGKDVLAAEIHRRSSRSDRPMVSVDIGSLPESLFESELFGHVRGAFTDARTDRAGKFEEADGGTLFLDEIGNIPLHLQAKLLRVLQNRTVVRVGDNRPRPIDIRLICATNVDLEQRVRDGLFREDLFYRINTVRLTLPPLRERPDEILPLARLFLERFAGRYGRNVREIAPEAERELLHRHWSGNIRQLANCIERGVILSEGRALTLSELEKDTDTPPDTASRPDQAETMEMAEERTIRQTLERCGGNLSLVAKTLNISRPTLYSKLKKYNI